jgi:uncharacterized membrane protein YqgA involved in biofilm formation
MIGTLINIAGIILGGIAGLCLKSTLSYTHQSRAKVILAVATVVTGLSMVWRGIGGGFFEVLRQCAVVFLALILGNLTGRFMHLQDLSNRLGHYAKDRMTQATTGQTPSFSVGFLIGAVLFCVSPMAFLGAFYDGLTGKCHLLVIKAVIDGLAVMALTRSVGWSIILSCVPLLAFQGSISLLGQYLEWWTRPQPFFKESLEATGGFLVFSLSLVILELKKIALTNYLPCLVFAAVLGWFWW